MVLPAAAAAAAEEEMLRWPHVATAGDMTGTGGAARDNEEWKDDDGIMH